MKKLVLSIAVIISINIHVNAQGCSDAGFCTMGGLKPTHTTDTTLNASKNTVKVGLSYGIADAGISVTTGYVGYSRVVNKVWSVDARLPFVNSNGALASVSGLSDLYLNTNFRKIKNSTITAGLKIPLSNGNIKSNGIAYPLNYQPSLGTLDVILGYTYMYKKWMFSAAIQKPLTKTKNEFINGKNGTLFLADFSSTNQLDRGNDALLRVAYLIQATKKLKITPSILPIYHVCTDVYKGVDGKLYDIKGSKGLTVNANIFANYTIQKNHAIEVSIGAPLVVRDARPDGLTRALVLGVEYAYKF
jgi:hypothetical protein